MRDIVLNIPHSSTVGIFDEALGRWMPNPLFINDCVRKQTDWYTDVLFNNGDKSIKSVVFPYSRFVCDVERLDNDPLESEGQGILYTKYRNYVRGAFTDEERNSLLKLRSDHLNKLSQALKEDSVLIDCHSFSAAWNEETDICIGFNDDWSYDEKVVDIIQKEFTNSGYKVALNHPYSNSITPKAEVNYKSVMIEVNKRVYMDENLLLLNRSSMQWTRWYGCLSRIYQRIKMSNNQN